jgi:signal peptidase I
MSSPKRRHSNGGAADDDPKGAPEEPAPRGTLAAVWDQVGTIVLAVAIALSIRAFLVEPFRIPSGSMLPTLLIGDHLFVNKFIYGPRIPFTDWRLPGLREPQRGDVVVFEVARGNRRDTPDIVPADKYPDLPRDDFVKRIAGLPGDRIRVENSRVWINGVESVQVNAGELFDDEAGRELEVLTESLGDCVHLVLDDPRENGPQKSEFIVPEGRYFMVGDNRDHSNDSRIWGTVRLEEMRGPAFILYWSWDVNGNALEFFNPVNWWTADKRWNRVFDRVRCQTPEEAADA